VVVVHVQVMTDFGFVVIGRHPLICSGMGGKLLECCPDREFQHSKSSELTLAAQNFSSVASSWYRQFCSCSCQFEFPKRNPGGGSYGIATWIRL